jgi:hypothetical protein
MSTAPSLSASLGLSIRFWLSAFSTMIVTAFSGPAIRGSSCVPPQPGRIPRNTSGCDIPAALDARVR